jgi:hypothetical protein
MQEFGQRVEDKLNELVGLGLRHVPLEKPPRELPARTQALLSDFVKDSPTVRCAASTPPSRIGSVVGIAPASMRKTWRRSRGGRISNGAASLLMASHACGVMINVHAT